MLCNCSMNGIGLGLKKIGRDKRNTIIELFDIIKQENINSSEIIRKCQKE